MIITKRIYVFMFIIFSALFFISGCDDAAENGGEPGIEIVGDWTSNYGGSETISNAEFSWWGYIRSYDNSANTLYYQSKESDDPDDPYANKFGRIVWTDITAGDADGDENYEAFFYYCATVYGKDTLQEAIDDSATADSSDPANSGCGGFSWTRLSIPIDSE